MSKRSRSGSASSVPGWSLDISHQDFSAANNPNAHPLSPAPDDPSFESFITNSNIETYIGYHHPRRRPPSIKSFSSVLYDPPDIPTKSPPIMRASNTSTRNRIFNEYITSTAHPALQAHSLIPPEIVDDEKAVRDMLAEAMNDAPFISGSPTKIDEEETTPRPATPMSAIDIPIRPIQVDDKTRPRSASNLSLRRWAGMIVGRGESGKRSATAPTNSKPNPIRSSSDPTGIPPPVDVASEEPSAPVGTFILLASSEL